MKPLRTIIIDDERPARQRMYDLIDKYNELIDIIGEASCGTEGIELIDRLNPDLIFLDVQMPGLDGFAMLVELTHQPMVIFTTAYEQFAIKAFEENAVDYLLKPIDDNRFAKCMEKLRNMTSSPQSSDFAALKKLFEDLRPKKEITAIPVKSKDKILLIRLHQIAFLEAEKGYVTIHKLNGDQHLTDLSLLQLEEKLPSTFLRVQKSYIINTEKIQEITKYFNNRLIISMDDHQKSRIISGTTYISQIRSSLNL